MSRPRIVRADTLDLQDQTAPSAKDHSKPPVYTSEGMGPHQEQTIRRADRDSKTEMLNGPIVDEKDDHERDEINMYDGQGHIHMDGDNDMRDESGGDSDDGDLVDGDADDLLDDDLMDKISSSPSIDDEDIDFEFVYALHNFVATVEGQANAAKGDTMVLLDDSNSYWWLVRVVKDGSIGYLPAEHIETPTERLARLNKHRNVDLSATMLGDNSEKSKNPLKKAMRRRNAKTVSFNPPTYIEASDVDFMTDDEMDDGDFLDHDEAQGERDDVQDEDHDLTVEPLKPKVHREKESEEPETGHDEQEAERISPEKAEAGEEYLAPEENISRSRNGTVRNTDSFFKDDSAEPKKISLTPNLLRDESKNASLMNELKEDRVSLESTDKAILNDKIKDDKKRKDKKPGMLSGLFKRKDKKKGTDEDIDEEKYSLESSGSSPPPKTSLESVQEGRNPKTPSAQRPGKLQKQPPVTMVPRESGPEAGEVSPTKEPGQSIRQVALDDVSTSDARETASFSTAQSQAQPFSQAHSVESVTSPTSSTTETAWHDTYETVGSKTVTSQDREVESPVDVSPVDVQASEQRGISVPPVSPPETPVAEPQINGAVDLSSKSPTWSDADLRTYLDEQDIHDLFVIVHDKSNVPPAGPDHPITGSLFKEESRRLNEMTSNLDDMLVDWIGRRMQRSTIKSA